MTSRARASVITLGCKVNQYESQAIAAELAGLGMTAECGFFAADLYIINTCSVTAEADKKSRQAIARALKFNADARVIVVGCSSQNDASLYTDRPEVIAVFGTGNKIESVKSAAAQFLDTFASQIQHTNKTACVTTKSAKNTGFNNMPVLNTTILPTSFSQNKHKLTGKEEFALPTKYEDDMTPVLTKTRGYLKIQDGCDSFCAYCRVPYLRGRSRSRSIKSIAAEIEMLSKTAKEIVFAGVDISAFGKDFGSSLLQLIQQIDLPVRGRLSSLECNIITPELLQQLEKKGFCDHFHLSLQSGCDTVLKRMNRKYTTAEYLEKVRLIREVFPYAGITTDIIAGFADESETEHQQTLEFLQKVGFSDIHVFPFSPRKGTKAYDMPQLDKSVRKRRAKEISDVAAVLKTEFLQKNLGRVTQVYAEEHEDGFVSGLSTNYIKVYTRLQVGELAKQKLVGVFRDGMLGEDVKP